MQRFKSGLQVRAYQVRDYRERHMIVLNNTERGSSIRAAVHCRRTVLSVVVMAALSAGCSGAGAREDTGSRVAAAEQPTSVEERRAVMEKEGNKPTTPQRAPS